MKATGIANSQQAQNELDHLCKKNLIERIENDGIVSDGSRYLYRKDPNVGHLKDKIIRAADNKKVADNLATKRRPIVRGLSVVRIATRELRKKKPLDILYLMANPDEKNSLRVDAEMRQVLDAVRGSKLRDHVNIHQSPAADLDSIITGLNDHAPRIVHFSGHGYRGGIAVDHAKVARPRGKVLTFELLGQAFESVDSPPDVVVLNACESAGAQRVLLPSVKALIVMKDSISDLAATNFATKFYAAIASGQSLKSAFKQGLLAVAAASIDEVPVPELVTGQGVDPAKVYLV
ncbi:MAG TPA: CHAT domain-containing protein [Caulobacterales bacterium]|nr:CHAT domain-containing protein [Caulobacterales bacterium]